MSDPLGGQILTQENGYDTENTALANQITTLSARAAAEQAALTAQVQAADRVVRDGTHGLNAGTIRLA